MITPATTRTAACRLALLLALALQLGCSGAGAGGRQARQTGAAPPAPPAWPGAPTPEALMREVTAAWNADDPAGVARRFSPSRRASAMAHHGQLRARVRAARIARWQIDHTCHGHGPDWLIVRTWRTPRAPIGPTRGGAGEPVRWRDDLWIVYSRGRWWLYGL